MSHNVRNCCLMVCRLVGTRRSPCLGLLQSTQWIKGAVRGSVKECERSWCGDVVMKILKILYLSVSSLFFMYLRDLPYSPPGIRFLCFLLKPGNSWMWGFVGATEPYVTTIAATKSPKAKCWWIFDSTFSMSSRNCSSCTSSHPNWGSTPSMDDLPLTCWHPKLSA